MLFSNAGVDLPSTYSATDLLSTCYRYAVYIQTIQSTPDDDMTLCASHVKYT